MKSTPLVASALASAVISLALPPSAHADDLFVAMNTAGTINRISPSGAITPYASGVGRPMGIVFDSVGNLFVADYGTGTTGSSSIFKVAPGGAVSTLASGFTTLTGLAVDASNNVFVCSEHSTFIYKVSPAGGISIFSTAPRSDLEGLAFDTSGNLYCSALAGSLYKFTPAGGVSTYSSPHNPSNVSSNVGLLVDSAGTLFDSSYNTVYKINSAGNFATFANTGYGYLAQDSSSNLFVTSLLGNDIARIAPNGAVSTFVTLPGIGSGVAILPVPEPSSLLLLTLALPFLRTRRQTPPSSAERAMKRVEAETLPV